MIKEIKLGLFLLSNLCWVNLLINNNFLFAQSPIAQSIQAALQDSDYIICIDGGGSKTELQVLDSQGNLVELKQNGTRTYSIKAGGSNINVVDVDGVKNTFDRLFTNLKIEETDVDLKSIAAQCTVVGGFSGAGQDKSKETIKNLIKEYNFDENKIIVASDAEIALESVVGDGIILISGTGSICLGKKCGEIVRAGGLGRKWGDEGSGYAIGVHAFKKALLDEYNWGNPTNLKEVLRDYFKVSDLRSVASSFNDGEITDYQKAAIATIVFKQAEENDEIALKIINEAAQELGEMLDWVIRKGEFQGCPINFFGGIFKNKNSGQFIQEILKSAHIEGWKHFNRSEGNPTVFAVRVLQKAYFLSNFL